MTDRDDNLTPESERDHLAAEYVLGVLDAEQRARCRQLIASDADFAARVATWEDRLSPLNAAYADVTPPANTLGAVESRLFGNPAPAGIWNSLRLWRTGAIAALLAVVVLAGMNAGLFGPAPTGQDARMIATLQADGSNIQFAALYEADGGAIRISAVAGAPDEGRDFELWFIESGNAPVSLGLLNRAGATSIEVPVGQRIRITDGTIFAVSHEPLGGSTTGAPTGPVVAAGAIHKI